MEEREAVPRADEEEAAAEVAEGDEVADHAAAMEEDAEAEADVAPETSSRRLKRGSMSFRHPRMEQPRRSTAKVAGSHNSEVRWHAGCKETREALD